MKNRKAIKCPKDIKIDINTYNLKEGDVLILNILSEYANLDDYENISYESQRLSRDLKKDLGFKVPVIVLAGSMTLQTMNKKELLDLLK